jgi:hypothetical protein
VEKENCISEEEYQTLLSFYPNYWLEREGFTTELYKLLSATYNKILLQRMLKAERILQELLPLLIKSANDYTMLCRKWDEINIHTDAEEKLYYEEKLRNLIKKDTKLNVGL